VAAHVERRAEAVRRAVQRHRLGERDASGRDFEEPQGRLQADLVNPKAPRVLRSPGVGIGKGAHHDPARPHQQHAIARHDVSIAPGLRHGGGDLVGHGAQLDPRRRRIGVRRQRRATRSQGETEKSFIEMRGYSP